jgi:translation initiation factor 1
MNICPKCGLPLQACVCKEIAKKGQQQITVKTEKRRFGKISTLISGLEDADIKDIAKKLKTGLACGGTVKNKMIELQGNHKGKIKPLLVEMGFEQAQIKE